MVEPEELWSRAFGRLDHDLPKRTRPLRGACPLGQAVARGIAPQLALHRGSGTFIVTAHINPVLHNGGPAINAKCRGFGGVVQAEVFRLLAT
ncbi:hypothetical protein [Phaeovulum sp.]|uniref:hypothetical protein n=1 Tax=Phaeovulum sp. TaxID=2934796 RepID=UPI0035651248